MQNKASRTIRSKGVLHSFARPLVMGILNLTPDSFSDGGRYQESDIAVERVRQMIEDGADIIDIGAVSTRPFADEVSEQDEKSRLLQVFPGLIKEFPQTVFSIDTFRSEIARWFVGEGGCWVNDISGGRADGAMMQTVADLQVPYVMMHSKGKPQNMQMAPHYDHLMEELLLFFAERIEQAHRLGVLDIIVDPGFGFGKTLDHNYEILAHLERFQLLEKPLLIGLSRKSMVQKLLDVSPADALNGTSVLHAFALERGADILRVHDVKEAVEVVKIFCKMNDVSIFNNN